MTREVVKQGTGLDLLRELSKYTKTYIKWEAGRARPDELLQMRQATLNAAGRGFSSSAIYGALAGFTVIDPEEEINPPANSDIKSSQLL